MTQARTVVLDNEAIQAVRSTSHRKHHRVLAVIEAAAARNLRRAGSVRLVVPTAIRVEAAWDRQKPSSEAISRLRVEDVALDAAAADKASDIRQAIGVSVADAHLGSVLDATARPHAVLTSDKTDIRRIAEHLGIAIKVVPV